MIGQALKIDIVLQSLETSKFYDSLNWYTSKEPSSLHVTDFVLWTGGAVTNFSGRASEMHFC